MTWVHVAGALLGASLGYLGAWLSPRWTELPRKTWELFATAAAGAVIAYLMAVKFGFSNAFWHQLIFLSVLLTASLVDLHDRIIPNETVLFGLGAGALLQLLSPAGTWLQHLYGAAFGFGILLLLALLYKGGMGMGDVKLAAVIGWFLQWPLVGMGLLLAFLAGGLVSLLLLVLGRISRKDHVPFGPFLAGGAVVAAVWGSEILNWYLRLGR
jgi:leader peptidase (prepilin peptidase) / N-methyltransferase